LNGGAALAGPGGGPELRVSWNSPSHVSLEHHARARVFKAEQRFGGVEFGYSSFE